MRTYPEEFKKAMVTKLTGPGARSASELADEVGIHQTTLSRWIRTYATFEVGGMMKAKRPQDWSAEDRLEAIIEYESLGEEQRGEYLREKGLHTANVESWKEEIVQAYKSVHQQKKRRGDPQNKRIEELERELRRKDKALAETAALLVLKKKAEQIWGDRGEDE